MEKIKNPEKYIKRLKAERDRLNKLLMNQMVRHGEALQKVRDEAKRFQGSQLWDWTEDKQQTVRFSWHPNAKPGGHVAIYATVVGRHEKYDPKCKNRSSEITLQFNTCSILPD